MRHRSNGRLRHNRAGQGTGGRRVGCVAPTALDGLLLNPAEVNAALGATGMTLDKTRNWLVDDSDRIANAVANLILDSATRSTRNG
jgi:hypothetical protein